jgi:hypothetical protein
LKQKQTIVFNKISRQEQFNKKRKTVKADRLYRN